MTERFFLGKGNVDVDIRGGIKNEVNFITLNKATNSEICCSGTLQILAIRKYISLCDWRKSPFNRDLV